MRRCRNVPCPRRERAEHRIEPRDDLLLAADHQAVSALEPPHAARGADVEIMDAALAQPRGARDVVLPEAVAAVDDGVAAREQPGRARRSPVSVTAPAGSISQTVRGAVSRFTRSCSAADEVAPSRPSARLASRLASNTTHWCPLRISRRAMFAPMRPSPTIPICITFSLAALCLSRSPPGRKDALPVRCARHWAATLTWIFEVPKPLGGKEKGPANATGPLSGGDSVPLRMSTLSNPQNPLRGRSEYRLQTLRFQVIPSTYLTAAMTLSTSASSKELGRMWTMALVSKR